MSIAYTNHFLRWGFYSYIDIEFSIRLSIYQHINHEMTQCEEKSIIPGTQICCHNQAFIVFLFLYMDTRFDHFGEINKCNIQYSCSKETKISYWFIYLSDQYLGIEVLILWDWASNFLGSGSFRILLRVLFDLTLGEYLGDFILWCLFLGIYIDRWNLKTLTYLIGMVAGRIITFTYLHFLWDIALKSKQIYKVFITHAHCF